MPSEEHRGVVGRNIFALGLLAVGSLQMIGYLSGVKLIRGLGASTAASPLPKVFSSVRGFETFAADFTLIYEAADGGTVELPITPERIVMALRQAGTTKGPR